MTHIATIHAREILDGTGHLALEVDVALASGALGRASMPCANQDATTACSLVNERLNILLRDQDALEQRAIDQQLLNFPKLGRDTSMAVSLAVAQAAAFALDLPFYRYAGGIPRSSRPLPILPLSIKEMNASGIKNTYLMPLDRDWTPTQAMKTMLPLCLAPCTSLTADNLADQNLGLAFEILAAPGQNSSLDKILSELPDDVPVSLVIGPAEAATPLPPNSPFARRRPLGTQAQQPCQAAVLNLLDYPTLTNLLGEADQARHDAGYLILDAQAPGIDHDLPAELAASIQATYLMAGAPNDFEGAARYNQLARMAW